MKHKWKLKMRFRKDHSNTYECEICRCSRIIYPFSNFDEKTNIEMVEKISDGLNCNPFTICFLPSMGILEYRDYLLEKIMKNLTWNQLTLEFPEQ
jgi:hypothetical protein